MLETLNAAVKSDESRIAILAEPTAAEIAAIADAEEVQDEVAAYIKRRRKERCKRSESCNSILRVFHRKDCPCSGFASKFHCKKLLCDYCTRKREFKYLKHAQNVLLAEMDGSIRVGPLYATAIPQEGWKSLSRTLRRHGGGFTRFRLSDGSCAVLAEQPFGERCHPVKPADAVRLVLDWVGKLAKVKNAVRFLGTWKPTKAKSEWVALKSTLSVEEGARLALDCGATVLNLNAKESAFTWGFEEESQARLFFSNLTCPRMDIRLPRLRGVCPGSDRGTSEVAVGGGSSATVGLIDDPGG